MPAELNAGARQQGEPWQQAPPEQRGEKDGDLAEARGSHDSARISEALGGDIYSKRDRDAVADRLGTAEPRSPGEGDFSCLPHRRRGCPAPLGARARADPAGCRRPQALRAPPSSRCGWLSCLQSQARGSCGEPEPAAAVSWTLLTESPRSAHECLSQQTQVRTSWASQQERAWVRETMTPVLLEAVKYWGWGTPRCMFSSQFSQGYL